MPSVRRTTLPKKPVLPQSLANAASKSSRPRLRRRVTRNNHRRPGGTTARAKHASPRVRANLPSRNARRDERRATPTDSAERRAAGPRRAVPFRCGPTNARRRHHTLLAEQLSRRALDRTFCLRLLDGRASADGISRASLQASGLPNGSARGSRLARAACSGLMNSLCMSDTRSWDR